MTNDSSTPEPAHNGPDTDVEAAADLLVRRFVHRSEAYRNTGGMVGLCVMVLVVILTDSGHGVKFDFPGVLVYALAGSLVGSLTAEAFRFRSAAGVRTASLEVRRADEYRDTVGDRRLWVVWALSAVALVWGAVLGETRSIVLGALVALLAVLRWWATRRIVARPRPALPAALADADDRIRRVAIADGIGRPVAALSALAASSMWFVLVFGGIPRLAHTIGSWIGLLLWVAAVVWWWKTRHVGRDL